MLKQLHRIYFSWSYGTGRLNGGVNGLRLLIVKIRFSKWLLISCWEAQAARGSSLLHFTLQSQSMIVLMAACGWSLATWVIFKRKVASSWPDSNLGLLGFFHMRPPMAASGYCHQLTPIVFYGAFHTTPLLSQAVLLLLAVCRSFHTGVTSGSNWWRPPVSSCERGLSSPARMLTTRPPPSHNDEIPWR